MFTLTAIASGRVIDLSKNVTDWQPEVVPNFEYNRLQNNKLVKKYDLGQAKDKYYCTVTLALSFAEFNALSQGFMFWFTNYGKGQLLTVSTDLDLFFPNVYTNNNCVIADYKDLGYLNGSIFYKTRLISLRLYSPTLQSYATYNTTTFPTCFTRGIWQQDYGYSSKINIVQNGLTYQYTEFDNDSSKWTITYSMLTRKEANDMLAWLLSIRTDTISVTTNQRNTNATFSMSSIYNVESFKFVNNQSYYSLVLNVVQNQTRQYGDNI